MAHVALTYRRQYRLALTIAWFGVSLVALLCLVVPVVVPQSWILNNAPICWKQATIGEACSFCGMTRAFVLISDGRWGQAADLNRLAILLWMSFLTNSLVFSLFATVGAVSFAKTDIGRAPAVVSLELRNQKEGAQ